MSDKGKAHITDWLQAAPAVRGALVRGIRFPDQTFVSDVDARDFPVVGLEQAWRVVGDTFQVLSAQQFPATRLAWVYRQLVLHCAQRSDGAILGVFVSRKNIEADLMALNRMLTEFQALEVPADTADEPTPPPAN